MTLGFIGTWGVRPRGAGPSLGLTAGAARRGGFTMIEVLIATFVLVIAFMAYLYALFHAHRVSQTSWMTTLIANEANARIVDIRAWAADDSVTSRTCEMVHSEFDSGDPLNPNPGKTFAINFGESSNVRGTGYVFVRDAGMLFPGGVGNYPPGLADLLVRVKWKPWHRTDIPDDKQEWSTYEFTAQVYCPGLGGDSLTAAIPE